MKIVCLDAATLGSDADLSEIASLGEFESYEMTEPAQTAQRLAGAVCANQRARILRGLRRQRQMVRE